jgi:hypothetical protein
MAKLVIEHMGMAGVNVDKNPLELADDELTRAQNAISDPSSGNSTLRKRPGLVAFNTTNTAGVVLGGIDLPLLDKSASGTHYVFIGRGSL